MEDITKLFCLVDDFCRDIEKNFAGKLLPNGKKPTRTTEIEHSEIMTIILLYQQSPCKNFKTFYLHYLTLLYKSEFPKLPSYTRFVALKPRVLWHLAMLLHWLCGQSENTGISYIDTTPIAVCHAKRISKNKVFAGIAKLSKSTYGWFFGFKLHMVINENGEIHALTLTKGNVDDRIPVPNLTEKLTGLLFGDKGYIAKELFQKLFDRGLKLVTKVKKGMKNTLISLNEKILLRKRSIIETVFGYLKNRLEIEHTRHRSPVDFLVHIFSTLISYSIKSKKPSISYTSFLNPEFAFQAISNVLFPLRWIVNRDNAREAGFHSILHGLFYACDNPARVIIEFQLGGGERLDLVLLRSPDSRDGVHPIGIELKFAGTGELQSKKREANNQLDDYMHCRGYKRITDGDTVVLSYAIWNDRAQRPDTLISVKDVLRIKDNLGHSSADDLPGR